MKLVKPKKFLGQHFLKDLQVAKDIADTVDACPDIPWKSNPWYVQTKMAVPKSNGKNICKNLFIRFFELLSSNYLQKI